MGEYLLETTSGDWFLGLEFQLDCKLTEGNLQRCVETRITCVAMLPHKRY